jgi:hypothetical protein
MTSLEALMSKAIAVPLSAEDRSTADGFAAQAGRFADRVRRNTLAVLAVQRYLAWQGFETDLAGADCWHPALRLAADVADLPVVGLGRLECLVVPSGTTRVEVPLEAGGDRLAYVVLELADQPLAGKLLGFLVPEEGLVNGVELEELRDMDEFVECLLRWQLGVDELNNLPFELSLLPEDLAGRLAIVMKLERLFHQDEMDWGYGAANVLQVSGVRCAVQSRLGQELNLDELQELGERLMGLLASRWRE